MAVLTESMLRDQLKGSEIKTYEIEKNTVVTPAAREYLSYKRIKLKLIDESGNKSEENPIKIEPKEDKVESPFPKYEFLNGGYTDIKPEHMTQLFGNKLVVKNHRRIVFRGKIDSLQSMILQGQITADRLGKQGLVEDLEDVLQITRKILQAEVLEEKLGEFKLLGLEYDEIRKISHNPKKYFDTEHILPNYKMGEALVVLNSIRSLTREVEITEYNAFVDKEGEVERKDIVKYLNRLSSVIYVMMLKETSGEYK